MSENGAAIDVDVEASRVPDLALAPNEVKIDQLCADAVELALAAAREVAWDEVGEHLGVRAEAERVVTHLIGSLLDGYSGWYWAVTIGRAPGFAPTVAEVVLLPGADAVLAQAWVPWSDRLKPGDLSPGDLLPAPPDDARLAPGYLLSDDPAENDVAFELGFGRVRVLSREARLDAAERWFEGDGGPDTPMAQQAPANCGTCGFLVPLAGSLRAGFGVCANEITLTDGRVVSVEHGCGAHSEAGDGQFGQERLLIERGEVFDDDVIDIEKGSLGELESSASADSEPDTVAPDTVAVGADGGPPDAGDGVEGSKPVEVPGSRAIPASIDILQDLGLDF